MKNLKFTSLELAAFVVCAFLLTACGSLTASAPVAVGSTGESLGAVNAIPSPLTSSTSSSSSSSSSSTTNNQEETAPPLTFTVSGLGNHPRSVCIPAVKTLVLRMMPATNTTPLFPANSQLINGKTGLPLYDGSPATYTQLQLTFSIPGTSVTSTLSADVGQYSGTANFSENLVPVAATPVSTTNTLPTPEYPVTETIYGSSPTDGMCTYWESQLHGCTLSSVLQTALTATCPSGQQKILITNVVSNYPCQNDTVGWCQGGSVQTVPDYQQWSATIQAQTENTAAL